MNTRELLEKAKKEKYAIGAFNVGNLETLKAIVETASELSSPVIVEASPGEVGHMGVKQLSSLVRIYKVERNIPMILNLDHATSFDNCKEAIDAGFDYVHFDGSKLPLEDNIKIAKEVVAYAHDHGVLVEGEIDHIEGSSADHTKEGTEDFLKTSHYTDPEKAFEFVSKTGVDTFASFIGNLHGLYAEDLHLDFTRLEEISKLLPSTFLSLHGGSGIPEQEIKKAVKTGIVKINVNSELRIAYKNTLKKTLEESTEVAFYKLAPPAMSEVAKIVEKKIRMFGSTNKHDSKHSVILPIL